MFVDLAGEHIADIMTINRSLADIPSASAILDTSNYTFQAISYGKDAEGFKYHGHVVLSPSSDGIIKVTSYDSRQLSSYSSRTTASALQIYYNQYPSPPIPTDTRLERKSTIPNYNINVPDLGQYINPTINPELSAYAHLIGGFQFASGTKYKVLDNSGAIIFSGNLFSSVYNLYQLVDSSGFLTFAQYPLSSHQYAYNFLQVCGLAYADPFLLQGAIRYTTNEFPNQVDISWILPAGDCGALNLFGGVFHVGLWCLDIKQMLKEGKYPPYSFNALNNIRKYRLFSKKTYNRDLISYTDSLSNSGFKDLFDQTTGWDTLPAIIMGWSIRFV